MADPVAPDGAHDARMLPTTAAPAITRLTGAIGATIDGLDVHCRSIRWHWSAGDIAIWDESTTCHRALVDHFPQPRRMRRCVLEGSVPRPA